MKFFLKSIWMTLIAMFLIVYALAQIEDMIRRTSPRAVPQEDPSSYLANQHV